jgi:prephenate dehydrogenase
MSIIATELKTNAVVMDTAPVKELIANWARELLPEGRHYVGLTPVINPEYLKTHDTGVEAAHADLFRGGLITIVASMSASSEAVKLAADLTRLLGAATMFADPVEVDSQMSATHILPQLMAVALLNMTVDQPGWQEGRKLAGRAYAEVSGTLVLMGDPGALSGAAMLAGDNAVRAIDNAIGALYTLRNDIKNQDSKALDERVKRAREGWERWWSQRKAANWMAEEMMTGVETPKASEVFGQMLFGSRLKPKK